ncbi:MAG TPA: acyclic terpene utilization AtuA family protein [Stellaceae bacterium]|nr:acyclic terpene utilization AtuA family protein [Stellaceae bacterium]
MTEKIVRIGGASGYWGDTASAPRQLVEKGNVHYLVFDYLAEVTMSILAKMHARSPEAGYATDFITLAMKPLLREIAAKKIRVIANAGGVNLAACRAALEKIAAEAGVSLRIGTVEGDDLLPRLEDLRKSDPRDLATGAPLPERLLSVNAYLGGFPIAAALDAGADIVVTGRCVDSALVLGPLIHEFGWAPKDYDLLAAGSLAGHLLECGAQATGGNFTDWWEVAEGWDDMGFPIAEARADGSFVVTKPDGTGGLVSPLSLGEQMLYEIGDPRAYVLPDVICDFTQVRLTQAGKDRVQVSGARGRAPTGTYKVSATYPGGFGCVGTMVVAGFDAAERARRNGEAILKKTRRMLAAAGLGDFSQTALQIVGAESLYGTNARPVATESREVVLRLAIRHPTAEGAELFSKEYVGSGLSMSTGRCGLGAGRPSVSPAVQLHSFLIDKRLVDIAVRVAGEKVTLAHAVTIGGADAVPPPAPVTDALPPGRRVEVPLLCLAVARSGDKGNDANIGVMARHAAYLPAIRAALTPEAVKTYLAHLVDGAVERFDLPGTHALNFVLHDSLGGGGTSSLRLDTQAKTYAQLLLGFAVPVPEGWTNELGVSGR